MNEVFDAFESTIINQTFIATLLLITLNNIWRKIDLTIPLQFIRYILILGGTITLVKFIYYLFFELENEESMLVFLKRTTSPYNYIYIFLIISSIILPFTLLVKKIGINKYAILIISFLITFGTRFEKFVIMITSIHRGHLPSSWNNWFNLYIIGIIVTIISLTINIIIDIRKGLKLQS